VNLLALARSFADRARDAYAAGPRRARLAFLGVLALLVVLMSAKYADKISKGGDDGTHSRSAFLRWRGMINAAFAGENIYAGRNEYPNPPIMAILLKPFMSLPPAAGALAWFYAKVLMAVLACAWAFRLAEGRPWPQTPPGGVGPFALDLARAAAIVICLPALLGDLSHNNVNIFILFLVAGCLEAFRRRLDTLAGLTLALAIACKVTPLLFVGYFAWKRCWRVLIATVAGLALWLAIVPGLTFGWERNRELITGWYALMVERPLLKGEVTTEHPNQAVTGWVYRLFTHSPSYIGYEKTPEGDIPYPAEYHNLADMGRPAAWVVVKLLTAGFALAVVLLCRWPVRGPDDLREGWRFAAECGLVCLGMLLLSERTWKHHAVVLLVPLAALAYSAAAVELPRRVRLFVIGALSASFVLMAGPGMLRERAADLALVYGTHTMAFALLAAAVGSLLACALGRREGSRGAGGVAIPG
jgi:hypothetical protein